MAVYGMWWGGHGYSHGEMPEDMERFPSIKEAGRVLQEREDNGGWRRMSTYYVHRDNEPVYMPTVEGSTMELFIDADGGEPFARLSIGPRGGVVRENY